MTTPYRKAAEVNEPRVRYGWRLTERGQDLFQDSGLVFAFWLVLCQLDLAPSATVMCSMVAALWFGEVVICRFGIVERYEKP